MLLAGARPSTIVLLAIVGACWYSPALAQTYTGFGSCGGNECHTKNGEITWLTDKPGGKEHRGSLGKLRSSRDASEKYAKAVKLTNFEDRDGMCVKCHATYVLKAMTLEGVGCEGCHGAAGTYRDFHAKFPKDYKGAVQQGMRNLLRNPVTWIAVCRDCHVLRDKPEYKPLIDAGHKDGRRWDVSASYEDVSTHWQKIKYEVADILAAAKGINPNLKVVAPPSPSAPPPAAPPPTAPAPADAPPVPAAKTPESAAASPDPSGAKRDPGVATANPKERAATTITTTRTPNPTVPKTERTDPVNAAAVATTPDVRVMASPLALTPPPPVTAAGLLAALQDRVAGVLESLLRKNAVPSVPLKAPEDTPQTTGPDAELLRLQFEALRLAVEVLNLKIASPSSGAKPPQQ